MNLIITAGGTDERIDEVRSITNMSTGRLAGIIAKAILSKYTDEIENLYYVHCKSAVVQQLPKLIPIEIGGTMDLMKVLEELLKKEHIDGVVHAMAVSDYGVNEVTTRENLTKGISFDQNSKISSDFDELIIVLKKTPKVISHIKEWSPNTVLVGFKLLSGVKREELISTAHKLLLKNKCDYVLANDLTEINEKGHKGYLVNKDKEYIEMFTKEEIGQVIGKKIHEAIKKRSE